MNVRPIQCLAKIDCQTLLVEAVGWLGRLEITGASRGNMWQSVWRADSESRRENLGVVSRYLINGGAPPMDALGAEGSRTRPRRLPVDHFRHHHWLWQAAQISATHLAIS